MTLNLEFKARVRLYLNDAFNWYEGQKIGLGESFLATVYQAFEHLAQSPCPLSLPLPQDASASFSLFRHLSGH